MSVYSVVEQTYVDGRLYYSLSLDRENRLRNAKERNRLAQKMLSEKRRERKHKKLKKNALLFSTVMTNLIRSKI